MFCLNIEYKKNKQKEKINKPQNLKKMEKLSVALETFLLSVPLL